MNSGTFVGHFCKFLSKKTTKRSSKQMDLKQKISFMSVMYVSRFVNLAPVVEMLECAICQKNCKKTYCIDHWIEICPVDGIKNLWNNCDQEELWKGIERGGWKKRRLGVFREVRSSSLNTNGCSTENNIPFPLFYLCGKWPINSCAIKCWQAKND